MLHAYFRDVAPILSAALLPWFFLSPIFFRPAAITDATSAARSLEWVNPIAPFITAVRDVDLRRRRARRRRSWATSLASPPSRWSAGRALFARMQGELAVVV